MEVISLVDEEISRQTVAVSVKAGKLTGRMLAHALQSVNRRVHRERKSHQPPQGRQSVKQLMSQGAATNSIELTGAPRDFDRVARKWKVDYAFYKTGPQKYLLFFKSGQADAITACFSEYSRRVLQKGKGRPAPIRAQMKLSAERVRKQPKRERAKEAEIGER